MRGFWRSERRIVLALLTAALVVRVIAALNTCVIHADGSRFTLMARFFADGRWDEGLDLYPRMSPLYPFLILLSGSGAAIAAVFGALSILPVYALARAVWDRRVATIAAGLVAFHGEYVRLGGEMMCESLFCFWFFTAMEFVRRAAEGTRWADWALAGIAGGFAVLTRPEGVYVLPACAGWAVVRGLALGGWGRRAAGVAVTLLLFVTMASPYIAWIHAKTGRWDVADSPFSQELKHRLGLSGRGGEASAVEAENPPPPTPSWEIDVKAEYVEDRMEATHGFWRGRTLLLVQETLRLCSYVLFPFLILGLVQVRRRPGDWFVILVMTGFLLPPILMLYVRLMFSTRYMLPGFLFGAPLMASGFVAAGRWGARLVPEPRRGTVAVVLLGLLAVVSAAYGARPTRMAHRTLADAGRWIRAQSAPRPVLLVLDRRVSHYADGYAFAFEPDLPSIRKAARARGAHWIVITGSDIRRAPPGFLPAMESAFPLAHVVATSSRGREVRIYRASPKPEAPDAESPAPPPGK